jgi:hypothetical protein
MSFITQNLLTNLPLHYTSLFSGNKREKNQVNIYWSFIYMYHERQNMESDLKNRHRKEKKKQQKPSSVKRRRTVSLSIW